MSQSINVRYDRTRWLVVLASLTIQLCLGVAYIWGVFQPEVVNALAWSQKNAALSFSFLLGMLGVGKIGRASCRERV